MKRLNEKLKPKKERKFIIIFDNYAAHKTEELIKFYKEEKINILFNVQYCSYFNCIELSFRVIKKLLYYKLYETKDELINELLLKINNEDLKNTLIKNYRETLEEYLRFFENHKFDNVNNFQIEI